MITVSLYARVSSGKQVQGDTIASQITAIENKISADGHKLLSEYKFIDNGYSGSDIIRPSLEKLRDQIAEGNINKVYIHSPDRLARKYVHQMLLVDEFKKLGVETVFLNCQIDDNPESQLLLQIQGMIAEYERAKIMERSRRGKIHAANKGSINVMSGAPYGYRYINKHIGGGQAFFEINEEEAEVIRKMFFWVGRGRVSIGEVCHRLRAMSIVTRTGKRYWDRSVVCRLLQNPAYKGQAAFGKKKLGVKLKHVRPQKRSCEQPKDNYSTFRTDKENWIYIPVPNIINEDLFDIVQEQLTENKRIARRRRMGANYLLQGLTVCQLCHYGYHGISTCSSARRTYYRCTGTERGHFGGNKMCNNRMIRTDVLDVAVWEEVKYLLKNPTRILEEYKRRLSEIKKSPLDQKSDFLEKKEDQLNCGIARLIDGYTQGYINEEEFKPRIKAMKQTLQMIGEQKKKIFDQKRLEQDLTLVVTTLEEFSSSVNSSLDNADWLTRRDIIRTLVKRIEINHEDVHIVFRVKELPDSFTHSGKADQSLLQHCCRSQNHYFTAERGITNISTYRQNS
ncbi:recombinase family protein [Wolbachia endosymbiont (group A) of Urophora cardui]|uniref:recombinase family protein n=1 Tax=Wolbachia endosymbiont (group A) of Urophora cardui TaxID=3066156 RepID=UPI003342B077